VSGPSRGVIVRWEPKAAAGYLPGTRLRAAYDSCPECGASWDEWCALECEGPIDPWSPIENSRIRRYFG
jgi:hypothetical protein